MKQTNIEFETKVLEFDRDAVVAKLRELGAQETEEFLTRRYVFDIESDDIDWIRLRQMSDRKPTLTYKHKLHGNTEVGKTVEIEVEVDDFEKCAEIMKKIPFKAIYYEENKNHIFKLDGIEWSIDSWPGIKPYLEVEAESKERVDEGLAMIELAGKDVGDKDIVDIYKEVGLDIHAGTELKFK